MNKEFDQHTTAHRINLSNITEGTLLYELIAKLNTSTDIMKAHPIGSIMGYDQLCNCDDGFLCEHRLQFIVDYIKDNYIGKIRD